MRTLNKTLLALLTGVALLSTASYADVKKGQKLYLKTLKSKCEMNGTKFAAQWSQSELEDAKDEGKLTELFSAACPNAEKIINNKKFIETKLPHIYDFAHEYANDSGNVPSCG
jgi:hypothetical protein